MAKSFDYIKECNNIRKELDLPEMQVTNEMMLYAQLDMDYSDVVTTHARQFPSAENLYWGSGNPFDGWYDSELAIYSEALTAEDNDGNLLYPDLEKYVNAGDLISVQSNYASLFVKIGHYLNIINEKYTVTGFAYRDAVNNKYKYEYAQEFYTSSKNTKYSVDEYEELFNDYYNDLYEIMNMDIHDYTEEIESTRANIVAKEKQIEEKTADIEECDETIIHTEEELIIYREELASANEEKENLENTVALCVLNVANRKEAYNNALDELDEATTNYTLANKANDEAKADYLLAKDNYDAEYLVYQEKVNDVALVQEQADMINGQIDSLNEEVSELSIEVMNANTDLVTMKNLLEDAPGIIENNTNDIEELESTLSDKEDILNNALEVLNEKKEILTPIETEYNELRNEESTLKEEESELQKEVSSLENIIYALENEVKTLNKSILSNEKLTETLNLKKYDKKNEIVNLENEIDKINIEVNNFTEEKNKLSEEVENLRTELEKLTDEREDLEGDVAITRKEVKNLNEEINNLTIEVDNLNDSVSEIKANVTELKSTIENLENEIFEMADLLSGSYETINKMNYNFISSTNGHNNSAVFKLFDYFKNLLEYYYSKEGDKLIMDYVFFEQATNLLIELNNSISLPKLFWFYYYCSHLITSGHLKHFIINLIA